MSSLYLTDTEIADICAPLTTGYAQVRYLTSLGMLVQRKPNGKPLLARREFERAMIRDHGQSNIVDKDGQPNREAYLQHIKKDKRNGPQASQ